MAPLGDENLPIIKRLDGSYVVSHHGKPYHVAADDDLGAFSIEDVEAFLEGRGIAPEEEAPPPPPSPLEEKAELRLFLSSTDWYIIRKQETGEDIPDEILKAREDARARINALEA